GRYAAYCAPRVSQVAAERSFVVNRQGDHFLRAHQTLRQNRRTAAFRKKNQIDGRLPGEVMNQRGDPERAAPVQRIRGLGSEDQDGWLSHRPLPDTDRVCGARSDPMNTV